MHSRPLPWPFLITAAAVTLAPVAIRAQVSSSAWDHVDVGLRMGFNIDAKFSQVGARTSGAQPGPATGGGLDRTYDDGFVRLDSSGNSGGLTWNWGYQQAAQVPGNDTLLLHAANITGATATSGDDPYLGFEASYARDLGHPDWGRWGIKLAFGYTDLEINDTQALAGDVQLITDTYALGGIKPPLAPYAGSFSGPGAVIGDAPTRSTTTIPGGAVITGSRRVEATLYDLRLGPYAAWALSQRFSIQFGGGLALGYVDSTFSYNDLASTAAGTGAAAGNSTDTDCLVGAFAEAGVAFRFCAAASVFANGQFQYLGTFKQSAGGREAELDLGQSIFCVVGLDWSF